MTKLTTLHVFFRSSTMLLGLVVLAGLLGTTQPITAADITIEPSEGGQIVKIDGELFTEYLTESRAKPILWPIIGPTGKPVTRAFPMEKIKGERWDHPHHRSLWFTHGDVNGVDFWAEGKYRGHIVHREFVRAESTPAAVIETVNDWVDADGKKHLEDRRVLKFNAGDNTRSIDFDITLTASEGPVVFGDTKEGTMGIRVATSMDVEQKGDKPKGHIVNSEGLENLAAWGKPAPWVDYYGTVDGDIVGIAVMNHPSSFRYPTSWHVRTYGLFAANPFGLHHFQNTKEHIGEFTLPEGESISLRYRFLFHKGDEKAGHVSDAFKQYAAEEK